jgi:hypothetical protein
MSKEKNKLINFKNEYFLIIECPTNSGEKELVQYLDYIAQKKIIKHPLEYALIVQECKAKDYYKPVECKSIVKFTGFASYYSYKDPFNSLKVIRKGKLVRSSNKKVVEHIEKKENFLKIKLTNTRIKRTLNNEDILGEYDYEIVYSGNRIELLEKVIKMYEQFTEKENNKGIKKLSIPIWE